jgi:glycolate oxidase FAD binding subunit
MINQFTDTIRQAAERREPLQIRASGSKDFYGGALRGTVVLDVSGYHGVVDYDPSELVLTARAGTPLVEIEQLLSDNGQMLPFEPPHFGPHATLGGCVAAGLSGPRRPYAGSVRDFVLGVRLLDGQGQDLRFGGQVMKNVAGYDVSRLLAGSLGTLGVMLEISLKVLPRPAESATLRFAMDETKAVETMNRWAGQPLPLTASSWHDGTLISRLEGAATAVKAACDSLGGGAVADADSYWKALREHNTAFFQTDKPLWRFSLPSTAAPLSLSDASLIEWGGALRWVATDDDVGITRKTAEAVGGQATLFRGGNKQIGVFHPLPEPMLTLHQRVKHSFDPQGVFNPGRLHQSF